MTQYNIGQKRFQGSGCVEKMETHTSYKSVGMSDGSDTSNLGFQDAVIFPDVGNFVKGQDYYLKVRIPQDMNYDMTFNIKLMPPDDGSADTKKYQFVKRISINRGGTGTNVYNVVLYEKSNGEVAVDFPFAYDKNKVSQQDKIYTDIDKTKYYLGVDGTYVRTNKFNDIALAASWKQESSNTYGVFEMVFRPVSDEFTSLLLEMERTAEDYNIQRSVGENTEYGRKITITPEDVVLHKLVNQIPEAQRTKGLSRIGIWGHPGLMMAINGEEIRVGPSGHYEQDVINIKSLGVVAEDNNWADNWTLDYEYITTAEAEEEEGV